MKLLFDQNLSYKLCLRLADLFPGSEQVRQLGLDQAEDRVVWEHAKLQGHCLVTQDADFADMAALYGPPPKVIWLRSGNQSTEEVEILLRAHAESILAFGQDTMATCLELHLKAG